LWTVARHVVVDGERARRARPAEVAESALGVVPVDDGVDQALVAQLVAEAIETLSPEHRAAVVETYFRGRSVAEAAHVLGVPAGTVKSRTYYALRALRLALEERGITGPGEAT
jgi:RNA polymerase sigma-70 factor (ECF subfamily)